MSKYVVDTFCFYWAGIHSYVLVRVLQQSIALLPLQSQAAFLFFHQAQQDITLENVLNDCQATQWKQCQCEVDGTRFDQHIVLTTSHSSFKLTARSFTEKMMFLNLFKFNHQNIKLKEQQDYKNVPSDTILESLQKINANHLEQIQHQVERLERAKQCMLDYTNQLNLLDQSLDFLIESALVPITTTHSLSTVKRELGQAVSNFHLHRERVSELLKRILFHSDFLDEARRKYEVVRKRVVSHAWYPWSPLLAVLVVVISIVYYYYHHHHL